MERRYEKEEIWEREISKVHHIIEGIFNNTNNMHGDKWRYKTLQYYWKMRTVLINKTPKDMKPPELSVMRPLIEFFNRMERIDPE